MVVRLSDYEMIISALFSSAVAENQQHREFGSTAERTNTETAKDTIIGKRGELAFARYLQEEFGLHLPVNFQVYPITEGDDADFVLNGWSMDIKATEKGRNLLVTADKANRDPADVYIVCTVDKEMGVVDLKGCISVDKLRKRPILKAGQFIPNTTCRLQADNYCVPFTELHDLKDAIEYMRKNRKVCRKM